MSKAKAKAKNVVNIRPGVMVLSVLRHLNYQPWFALAEFVDNAVQSFVANKAKIRAQDRTPPRLHVGIKLDGDRLVIHDNAAGIALADFPRAFRAAEVPPDTSMLAEFGIGMKAASCWFSSIWSVRTSALGEPFERTVRFDIDRIVRDSIEELEVSERDAKAGHHFTEITLEKLHRPIHSRTLGKIKDHLADIYREFFRSKELVLQFGDDILEYHSPTILNAPYCKDPSPTPKSREWKTNIDFDLGPGMRVSGFAAIRDPAKTTGAGFALFRRRRLIQGSGEQGYRPEQIFGKPNDFRYQRLFGELHLEGFKVSHTKDGIVWEDYEEALLELLDEELRKPECPLLQQARDYRVRKAARDVRELGQAAVDGTAEAVEKELPSVLDEAEKEPPAEHLQSRLPPAKDASTREISVSRLGRIWKVSICLTYDPAVGDWLRFSDSNATPRPPTAIRHLGIEVAMMHPFMEQFCRADQEQIEALLRVATAFAIAETVARDAGVRQAGTIRHEMNRLLREALSEK